MNSGGGQYLSCLHLRQFVCQENPQANPFDKASFLMIPAQPTDRIYNVIHLRKRHAVHLLVELVEVCAYLLIIIGIVFVVVLVEHIRFHDLRHTFATLALQNGIDVKTVSSMLGHSSARFTLATYTHATNKVQEQAAAKMGNLLKQAI